MEVDIGRCVDLDIHACLLCAGYWTVKMDDVHSGCTAMLIDDGNVIRSRTCMGPGCSVVMMPQTTTCIPRPHEYIIIIVM